MSQDKTHKPSSRCGLDCIACPAYIATLTNDDLLRKKTADEWNKRYNATGRIPITEKDINCLGCLSHVDPIYKHCKECGVRLCGVEKGVQNCGGCSDYKGCPKISSLHKHIPEGKTVCEKIHQMHE